MSVETFLGIAGIVLCLACYIGYRLGMENTCLKYKEQKVGGKQR